MNVAERDSVRWGLPQGVRLHRKTWADGGDVVVYNELSGQTHFLDPLSAAVLSEIERQPATAAALAARLAADLELEPDAALGRRVADICARFDALGLADALAP